MQTILQDEDGRQRANRAHRESAAAEAEIKRRDMLDQQTEAERVAHAQIANRAYNRPMDYAAIIKYRAVEPGYFVNLPTDEECRVALGIRNEAAMGSGEAESSRTLKLKK